VFRWYYYILLRKLKITPFSTFLDSLDKNSFINALTDSSEILVFLIVLLKNGCWVFSNAEFIIIDFNGEYIDDAIIDKNGKNSYDLTTKAMKKNDKREKLPISKSTIHSFFNISRFIG
jgi:hypothetical protein